MSDPDSLRAPLIRHFETLATDLVIGRHGDPHVAFVVFVYPDREPAVVPVTPSHSPTDLRRASGKRVPKDADTRPGRTFTGEDLADAERALEAAVHAIQMTEWRKKYGKPGLTLGAEIAETIRERWERHKQWPLERAMLLARHDLDNPYPCRCKRRFPTARGLSMHVARTKRGEHGPQTVETAQ